MTDPHHGLRVADMILNAAWMILTFAALAAVGYFWPYPSWSWGLLLGAAIGGSAVFVIAYAAQHFEYFRPKEMVE